MTVREECTAFLQWCLPRLEMRWSGFRRVRSQVCKRIVRRYRELGLDTFDQYRRHLEGDDEEWSVLDGLCRVTISRFYRDRLLFDALRTVVIPQLAAAADADRREAISGWSCGCASGEEPYTLAMAWTYELSHDFPGLGFDLIATDADPEMLDRARRARYPSASARDLPQAWRRRGFREVGGNIQLERGIRQTVRWRCEDVRRKTPGSVFDLVLCRNLVFTYYADSLQRRILREIARSIRPGGALVIGSHEALPETSESFEPWGSLRSILRRVTH